MPGGGFVIDTGQFVEQNNSGTCLFIQVMPRTHVNDFSLSIRQRLDCKLTMQKTTCMCQEQEFKDSQGKKWPEVDAGGIFSKELKFSPLFKKEGLHQYCFVGLVYSHQNRLKTDFGEDRMI